MVDIHKMRRMSPFYKKNNGFNNIKDIILIQAQREFEMYQNNTPNTYNVLVNNNKNEILATFQDVTDLEIRSDTKIVLTKVKDEIYSGDVLTMEDGYKWLVVYDKFKNTRNSNKVKAQPANYIIKIPFKSKDDEKPFIYQAPVVINPYLSDVRDDKQIMPIDSTIIYVNMRYDEYTKSLKQQDRLFIYGKAWQIAGIDYTNVKFPVGRGCMQFTCRPVQISKDLDEIELGVCNYYSVFPKDDEDKKIIKDNEIIKPSPVVPAIVNQPTIPPIKQTIDKKVSLKKEKDKELFTYNTIKLIARTSPIDEKVIFMFEGDKCKCKFQDVKDNSCVIKADGDVGVITVKAFIASDVTVIDTIRIEVKEEW